jgi:hypothetical protein
MSHRAGCAPGGEESWICSFECHDDPSTSTTVRTWLDTSAIGRTGLMVPQQSGAQKAFDGAAPQQHLSCAARRRHAAIAGAAAAATKANIATSAINRRTIEDCTPKGRTRHAAHDEAVSLNA